MKTDPDSHHAPSEQDAKREENNRWWVFASVVVGLVLLAILTYAILTSIGILDTQSGAAFITITQPSPGAVLDSSSPVLVSGQAGGVFEEGLVVQVLTTEGNVLVERSTTIDSPEAETGSEGSWSVELEFMPAPGIQGQITAFSTSPADGSRIASEVIDVVFESISAGEAGVDLGEHLWVLVSLDGRGLLEDTHIDLQFRDFLVEGFGGCNLYTSSYESRRSNLNLGLVTSTAKECEVPPGVLHQERAYFAALERVAVYSISSQQLNMFDGNGGLNLVYDAVLLGSVVAPVETMLPPEARVYIRLYDISLAGTDAGMIAEQVITGASEFPIPFTVMYDPVQIRSENTYVVQVRIEDDSGNLQFINPTAIPVITGDKPSAVDVIVEVVQK
jgi:putative lipoprotein